MRAEKTQDSNSSLLSLVINVIELLTWRDKGDGQVEAIKEMRKWLIEHEEALAGGRINTNGCEPAWSQAEME
ncbi:hypothetical protein ACFSQ7_21585 [Paenibacillus rhizoplanae]